MPKSKGLKYADALGDSNSMPRLEATIDDDFERRVTRALGQHALEHEEDLSRSEFVRRAVRLWVELDNPQETLDG